MASDRLLSILGLIGDQMFKEKDVPVIDKSRYMTNGQASINPVQEYLYGEMPGTPLRGTQFSGLANQVSERDLRRDPIRPVTVARDEERDAMEQTIIDRASLLNMPTQPMSDLDTADQNIDTVYGRQDANTAIQNLGYMTPGQMDNERASMIMPQQIANTGNITSEEMDAELESMSDVSGFAPLTPQEDTQQLRKVNTTAQKILDSDFSKNMEGESGKGLNERLQNNLMDYVKDYFGDEKSMLGLALAFNSMRLNPDQGLASVLGERIKTLDTYASKDSTYAEIVAYANQPGTSTSERNRLLTIARILKQGGMTPKEATTQAFKRDINNTDNEYRKSVYDKLFDKFEGEIKLARQAQQSMDKNVMVLNILGDEETEANVGAFGGVRQMIDRGIAFLGGQESARSASETEVLKAFLGSDVFPMIAQLGIGARGLDTPAERQFLMEVMTGDITLTADTLRILTEYRHKLNSKIVDAYNKKVGEGYFDFHNRLFSADGTGTPYAQPLEYQAREYKFLPNVEKYISKKGAVKTPPKTKVVGDLNGDGIIDSDELKQKLRGN